MTNKQLYASVKAGFIARHTSLHKVCNANGIMRQNARAALLGTWKGKKGLEVRCFLMKEAGIEVGSSDEPTANLTANLES